MMEDEQVQSHQSVASAGQKQNAPEMTKQVQNDPAGATESTFSGAAADFAASRGLKSPMIPPPPVPLKVVFQRILQSLIPSHPLPSFRNVSSITINLDTMIPAYMSDPNLLWHLAKVVEDEAPGEPRVIETFPEVEVLDRMPARKMPKKRRARKARGPLEVGALRRSTRLKKVHGFKDDESASAAAGNAGAREHVPDEALPAVDENMSEADPVPLEAVPLQAMPATSPGDGSVQSSGALIPYQPVPVDPAAPAAPYLSPELMKAIGTEYLKMPPGGVLEEKMANPSDDE
ncbi:unnamed protein product [Urochloa humidicola]